MGRVAEWFPIRTMQADMLILICRDRFETHKKRSQTMLKRGSGLGLYLQNHRGYVQPTRVLAAVLVETLLVTLITEHTRVEAGSDTSTVTLRVVRGDEMGLKIGRAIA
jgi:hypothetical protein